MAFDVRVAIAAAGADRTAAELAKVGAAAKSAGTASAEAMDRTAAAAERTAASLNGVRSVWVQIGSALGGGVLVAQAVQMADSITTLRNRLELATGSAVKARQAFDQLFQVAQQSRTSFTELGATYATLARAGQQLGLSQASLMTVTQAIGNAMAISGGSAASMQAALVQLGQGMASGVLRGEELNSVMEQAPRLAQALADGLGVPIGELRKLGEAGELTSQKVIEALTKSAPKLAEEVKNATMTVSQAFTVLGNSTTLFVGAADSATGASKALAGAMAGLAGAIEAAAGFIKRNEALFSIIGATLGAATAIAVVALSKALVTTLLPALVKVGVAGVAALGPVGLAVAGITVAVTAAVAAINAFKNSETGLKNRIAHLEGGDSIYGPRGAERQAELARLRQQLALKSLEGVDTSAEDARLQRSAAAHAGQQAELKKLAEIKEKLAGVDKEYITTVQTLAAAVDSGNLSAAEYVRLVGQMAAGTKEGKAAAQQAEAAQRSRQKALADALALEQRAAAERQKIMLDAEADVDAWEAAQLRAQGQAADAAEAALKAAEAELENFGKLKSEIAQTTLLRLKDALAAETLGTTAYASIYRQIEAQEKLVEVLKKGEARDAGIEAAKKTADEWKRASDDIERALTDALMRGFENGRGFVDSLVSSIKSAFQTMVLRPVVQAIVRPAAGAVADMLGSAWSGAGGGGNGWLLNLIGSSSASLFGTPAAYGAAIGTTNVAAGSQAAMLAQQTGGFGAAGWSATSSAAAGTGTGAMSWAASAMPWVALASAAYARGSSEYSKGWTAEASRRGKDEIFGGDAVGRTFEDLSVDNILNSLGKRLGMSDKWASILSGSTAIAQLIGRQAPQVTSQGITGSIGGGSVDAQAFQDWRAKGGWFRSDKSGTNYAALTADMAGLLDASAADVLAGVNEWAKTLGLPADRLASINTQIRVSMTGDAAKDREAVAAAFEAYQADLAKIYEGAVVDFRQYGESTAQTLERLSVLQIFSAGLNDLGTVFSRVAGLSVAAREQLISMAGGMEQLAGMAQGFVQNYYSRDEIAGLKASELQSALRELGVNTATINTRDDFRALVERTDVGTDAGRQQLVALLGLGGSFAGLSDYLAETGLSLDAAAGNAPGVGPLSPLLSTGNAQVNATNQVRDSINDLHQTTRDLLDAIRTGSYAGSGGTGPRQQLNEMTVVEP